MATIASAYYVLTLWAIKVDTLDWETKQGKATIFATENREEPSFL